MISFRQNAGWSMLTHWWFIKLAITISYPSGGNVNYDRGNKNGFYITPVRYIFLFQIYIQFLLIVKKKVANLCNHLGSSKEEKVFHLFPLVLHIKLRPRAGPPAPYLFSQQLGGKGKRITISEASLVYIVSFR